MLYYVRSVLSHVKKLIMQSIPVLSFNHKNLMSKKKNLYKSTEKQKKKKEKKTVQYREN